MTNLLDYGSDDTFSDFRWAMLTLGRKNFTEIVNNPKENTFKKYSEDLIEISSCMESIGYCLGLIF